MVESGTFAVEPTVNGQGKRGMKTDVLQLVADRHAALLNFWRGQGAAPEANVEAHCDIVYTLLLLGDEETVPLASLERFVDTLREYSLPGLSPQDGYPALSVHNFAYALAVLNLFPDWKAALYTRLVEGLDYVPATIVHPSSDLPIFPAKWAHHNWRVSHWIGGIPSILLSFSRSGLAFADQAAEQLVRTRDATDALLDQRTGLLRAYRSSLVQWMFRRLYAYRHDPDLGDLGGVAHLLWIDHVIGRRYVGLEALRAQASHLWRKHTPFMEAVPYCLDFDIIQALRTAGAQLGRHDPADVARAEKMMADIEDFFANPVPAGYSLHKIPGALATWHECALIAGHPKGSGGGIAPWDVVLEAHWL